MQDGKIDGRSDGAADGVADRSETREHGRVGTGQGAPGIEPLLGDGIYQRGKGVAAGQDQVLDGPPVPRRVLGGEERRHPRHVGRGHRGPAEYGVGVPRSRTENLAPGRSQMHGPPAEIRERRQRVGPCRGGHREDVRERVAGGIRRRGVVVRELIARGDDEEDPARSVRLDGVEQGLGKSAAAPAVIGRDDIDPAILHELHVLQAIDCIGRGPGTRGAQELARHEADRPVDSDDAEAVVPDGADRAGDMGAVVVVVHGIRVVVGGVDAEAVVDLPVPVVVDPVAIAVRLVAEHVRGQVRVRVVDPRVDHRHDDVFAPRRHVPRREGIDVCTRGPAVLARILEPPETAEARIVGSPPRLDDPVGLRIEDVGTAPVEFEGLFDVHPGRDAHGLKAFDDLEALVGVGAHQRVSQGSVDRQRRGAELYQDGVGSVAGRRLAKRAGVRDEQ